MIQGGGDSHLVIRGGGGGRVSLDLGREEDSENTSAKPLGSIVYFTLGLFGMVWLDFQTMRVNKSNTH